MPGNMVGKLLYISIIHFIFVNTKKNIFISLFVFCKDKTL